MENPLNMPLAITLIVLIIGISIAWIVYIRRSLRLDKEYKQLLADYKMALKNERIKFLSNTISKILEHEKLAYLDVEQIIQDIETLSHPSIELKYLEETARKRKVELENKVVTIY
jgi:hypothetical protein